MIAALSPADINYEETLSTLRWGSGRAGVGHEKCQEPQEPVHERGLTFNSTPL